ncbi:hypothetical protein [Phytohabitans houttuyneae]|uniref:Uncharacterized protein n=1 Tax=Phytohabitans houttuyneae TaxID=1076126 RepID=A0A6V8K6G5_9ACTN|nr:hypothetical protein [Phytohabitans houttuyneae]GFJ78011.1 hypothetical protein Phou_021910 [Phytohabitans houttuyneae]
MRITYPDSTPPHAQSVEDRARALALVERICGPLDVATRRTGAVLQAHGAALAWVRETTGRYPSPRPVADAIQQTAARLRDVADDRDPHQVLLRVAEEALAEHMAARSS